MWADALFQQFGRVLLERYRRLSLGSKSFQADFLAIVYAIWFGQLACPAHEVSLLLKVRGRSLARFGQIAFRYLCQKRLRRFSNRGSVCVTEVTDIMAMLP